MSIKTKKINEGFLLKIHGDLDITTSSMLRNILDEIAGKEETKALLINLSDVRYIDSVGVWVLAETGKNCTRWGVKFRLVEPSLQVEELFRLVRLESLIELFASEDEAFLGLYNQEEKTAS